MALHGPAGVEQGPHRRVMEEDAEGPRQHTAILFGCYTRKVMLRAMVSVVSALLLCGVAAGAPPEPPIPPDERPPQESFTDEISVSLSTVVVRAVDTWGRPILG